MHPYPSIFNDIIGPVMRGPSSSHTAASWRIGRTALDLLGEPLRDALVEFDQDGAWASNYREQGTVMGMNGGLLALDMLDEKMKTTEQLAEEQGISIRYQVTSFSTTHPNTVRLTLHGKKGGRLLLTGISLGGGAFEIVAINGFPVRLGGDCYETLLILHNGRTAKELIESLEEYTPEVIKSTSGYTILVRIPSAAPMSKDDLMQFKTHDDCKQVMQAKPLLPVPRIEEAAPPFADLEGLLEAAQSKNLDAGKLGILYEQAVTGLREDALNAMMDKVIGVIHTSIDVGLQGTSYPDRILHQQSHRIGKATQAGDIPDYRLINDVVANVTAIMESKSAMEVIVANPTAGSCGTVGGVLKALSGDLPTSGEKLTEAYFAAGIIGVLFAMGPGFSAEEHGCQVECGAASGMAAAAIVQLYGGSARQAVDAASMAIQNMIGLICDPVADRVEVPCLGKNISAAMNGLSAATMACAGYEAVIPLDEVIATVSRVSKHMPACNKCTGKGGLALSKAAARIKDALAGEAGKTNGS